MMIHGNHEITHAGEISHPVILRAVILEPPMISHTAREDSKHSPAAQSHRAPQEGAAFGQAAGE